MVMENKKAYEVIARKWRPQQFADVVGQEHVTRTLKNAINLNRVAHAYLFVGPRGIGKTSVARIFAKALNCAEGPTEKPCDKCPSCSGIMAGNNLDVREIDAASNRQIDDVRSLREDVKYVPNGRHKIYIIDEVHMLTTEAFNALLKTLEEPPKHVIFLFATTEPQKVPLTILSRCQRFDLRRIPLKMIVERLDLIAKAEKVDIDSEALLAVARAAEGGLRDAESALDQLIAFQGNKIREEDVLAVFGLTSRKSLEDLVTALFKGDVAALVRIVEQMDSQGKDMHRLLLELLEHCRNLLVFLEVSSMSNEMDLTESQLETLKNQAPLTDSERLLRIIDILTEAIDRLRFALSKKALLEVTLIRCARAATTVSLDQIVAELRQIAAGASGSGFTVQNSRQEAGGRRPEAGNQRAEIGDQKPAEGGVAAEPNIQQPTLNVQHSEKTWDENEKQTQYRLPDGKETGDELAMLRKDWHLIVEKVGRAAPLAKANLVDAFPAEVGAEKVVIAFDQEFSDRIEQAGHPRSRMALQKALGDKLRRQVSVEFITQKKPPAMESEYDAGPDIKKKSPPDVDENTEKAPLSPRSKWLSNEAVRKTLDLFEGRIVEIRGE